jgi:hypothetical protein
MHLRSIIFDNQTKWAEYSGEEYTQKQAYFKKLCE